MKLTKHFKLDEFTCTDGTQYPKKWVKSRLIPLCKDLEKIRKEFGNRPITITSGYRTPEHNKFIGGVKNSTHTRGLAVDFKVNGISARKVGGMVREMRQKGIISKGGIGIYSIFTHYDHRGRNATWRGK